MPLKVFVNQNFLELILSDEIFDFRNKQELITKIIQIEIPNFLYHLLINESSEKNLVSRITK